MPRIPFGTEKIKLPTPRATTGLSQVPIDITSAPERALAGVGQAIGQLGEAIYARAKQHEAEDSRIGSDTLIQAKANFESQFIQRAKEAKTPEEIMEIIAERTEWLTKYPDYSDLSKVNVDEFGYHVKRLKKIGWTDAELSRYQIKVQQSDNQHGQYFAGIAGDSRKTLLVQSLQATTDGAASKMLNNVYKNDATGTALDKAIADIADQPEIYLEQNKQQLTTIFIDDVINRVGTPQERPEDIGILRDVVNGVYNDNLTNIYKPSKIIDVYQDKARKGIEGWEVNVGIVENVDAYFVNPERVAKTIRGDTTKSPEVREKIITGLERRLDQHEENITRTTKAVDKTNMAYFNKQLRLIREGELKEEDIYAKPNMLSISDAGKLQAEARRATKEEETPINKTINQTIKDGRTRIIEGNFLTGFKSVSIKYADMFEKDLNQILEGKTLEEKRNLITPGASEYIIEKMVQEYKYASIVGIKDEVEIMKKRRTTREKGESIKDWEKRKSPQHYKLTDPKRIKAVQELEDRGIKLTPEKINRTIEFLESMGEF